MVARKPRNTFAKAATERADEIGHPVDDETREEAQEEESTEGSGKPSDTHQDVIEGLCVGGPMDGMPGMSRKRKGFLVIDQHNSRVWVYDYDNASGLFTSRRRDVHDRIRHTMALEGANYDVRAFDPANMKGSTH